MGYAFQFLKRERSHLWTHRCSVHRPHLWSIFGRVLPGEHSHPTRFPALPWGCRLPPRYSRKACEANSVPTFRGWQMFLWRFPPSAAQGVDCCAARKLAWTPWGRPFGGSGRPPLTQVGRAGPGRTEGRKFTASAVLGGK